MSSQMIVEIDDIEDPRLDIYRSLKATNTTRDLNLFVVEGSLLVERLLQSRYETEFLLTHPDWIKNPRFPIPENVKIYCTSRQMMTELVGFSFHQGIMACGRRAEWPTLGELLKDPSRDLNTIVICPAIDNPENLGSIARTAEALGVGAIIVGTASPDPLSRRLTRVSMGATLKLPVLKYENPHEALDELKQQGFEFVATLADHGCTELFSFLRPEKVGLLLGREREGLDPEFAERADHRVTISMVPGADSLNVSIAAGIFLYHFSQSKHVL
jgi:tRNA G18 (ribose-2'-O)-methylase SpoU